MGICSQALQQLIHLAKTNDGKSLRTMAEVEEHRLAAENARLTLALHRQEHGCSRFNPI